MNLPPLEPPDTFTISACQGWLELENTEEAAAEWEQLSPAGRRHPAGVELRWHILARRCQWDEAVEAGDELVATMPESSAGWLHRAYAIRRAKTGGLQQAFDALHPAAALFPEEDTIAYNLSCYLTQLGRPDDGWEWFLRSVQISKEPDRVKKMALADPDLEPLHKRVRELGLG